MVEFRQTAGAPPVFMEVNGRFWNSLPLACYAGADFPALLAQMAENRRRRKAEFIPNRSHRAAGSGRFSPSCGSLARRAGGLSQALSRTIANLAGGDDARPRHLPR